jgi:hypothetical protein
MNAVLIALAFVLIFCMLTPFLWIGSRRAGRRDGEGSWADPDVRSSSAPRPQR